MVLAYCRYVGGSDHDSGKGIAVDSAGYAYVTGNTESTEATLPVIGGPGLTCSGGYSDAFVAKVGPLFDKRIYLPRVVSGD
jgi:hypothetical protein